MNKNFIDTLRFKSYKLFFFLVVFFSQITSISSDIKYVLGARDAGLFSNFLGVLNLLVWCKKNNKFLVVYWNRSSPYYIPQGYNGSFNVWEYYFEPVSDLFYENNDPIHCEYTAPDGFAINAHSKLSKEFRNYIYNEAIEPYIRLKSNINKKINDFYIKHMQGRHTIGIHLRGTDKYIEIPQVSPEMILQKAKQEALSDSQFFVATDENSLLELAKKTLPGKIIYYDAHRSIDGKSLHGSTTDKAQLGEEVLIEVMLLSHCNKLIHTYSNVSAAVLFFNPEIESFVLSV